MPVSPSFVDHALDLLSLAGPVQVRRMFGGCGIWARGSMFGLLDDDELFLKTDQASRQAFLDAGCRQWSFESPSRGTVPTGYYRPPDEAHEDAEAMLPWATLALEAAARAAAAKATRGRKRAAKTAKAAGSAPKGTAKSAKAARSAPKRAAKRGRRGKR